MKPRATIFWFIFLLLTITVTATSIKKLTIEIVKTYPHDPDAFTQGLFFYNGYLYESTGQHGKSTMRQVDLTTGKVIKSIYLPSITFGEGATICNDRIFQLTWHSSIVLMYKANSLEPSGSLRYPERFEGWGITSYNNKLYISDGSNMLRIINPSDFSLAGSIKITRAGVPVYYINEMETVGNYIYANIWQNTDIIKIDPATGKVIAYADLNSLVPACHKGHPDNVLNGIAWNSSKNTFYVTGKKWDILYEIRLKE